MLICDNISSAHTLLRCEYKVPEVIATLGGYAVREDDLDWWPTSMDCLDPLTVQWMTLRGPNSGILEPAMAVSGEEYRTTSQLNWRLIYLTTCNRLFSVFPLLLYQNQSSSTLLRVGLVGNTFNTIMMQASMHYLFKATATLVWIFF